MPKTKQYPWLEQDSVKRLVAALGPESCRFVGGVVRDSLLGRPIGDIDVATSHPPGAVIEKLNKAGIKVVPTGLKHGTVTAVIENRNFEITTLRHDVKTFGRHAEVAFHDDWQADASRRDFTMNAIYLTPDAEVFDYFGGRGDLKAGRVKFIGDPAKRIEEDALRILRLFRFHAWFGKGEVDPAGLKAVGQKLGMLKVLSPERIRDEIFKLLRAPDPVPVLKVMEGAGVLKQVFQGFSFTYKRLEKVIGFEKGLKQDDPLRRLGAFLKMKPEDAKNLYRRFHLSNKERKRLHHMAEITLPEKVTEKVIRKIIYHHGLTAFRDSLFLNATDKDMAIKALKCAGKTKIPDFPVNGADLEKCGLKPGPGMGRKLKQLEARWIESDFTLSKKDLLNP